MSDTSPELPEINSFWDFSDPAKTEQAFLELLDRDEVGDQIDYQMEVSTQIARAQGLQRNFEQAHETLDQVETQFENLPSLVKVRYLLERGRVFNSSKQSEKAQPLFLEAWELGCKDEHDNYAVDAAHMLGIVEHPSEKALEWNEKALQLAEKSSQPAANNWLGSLYNNIGWTYHDQGDFEKALSLFERAHTWREEKGEPESIHIAKWCIARTLRSLKRTNEALARQMELLRDGETVGRKDGFVFEELAECHLELGDEEDAKPYFSLAYEFLSKDDWLVDNESDRINRLKQLAGIE